MRVLASPALINRWLNPYNWLLNTHLERQGVDVGGAAPWRLLRGQGDLCHLHWPDHMFNQRSAARAAMGSRAFLHLLREGRRQRMRIVWTVHNLRAHDGQHPALEQAFWPEFLSLVDGAIHLSRAGRDAAETQLPELGERRSFVIPHGHYRSEYVPTRNRDGARAARGLSGADPVVLFSGRIRPYKNVPALLRAFREYDNPRAYCLITGAPASRELRQELQSFGQADRRVRLELQHLRRADLANALTACDLVVLPYREILNSGSALLALSLDRPVLVPRRGALAELADAVGDTWVRCYDGELTGRVLSEAITWARQTARSARAPLGQFGWTAIARAHRHAYAVVCDRASASESTLATIVRAVSPNAGVEAVAQ